MTQPVTEKRFFFHANAVALAAHIRRKEDFFVPAVASSGLPMTGGEGFGSSSKQNFHDMISFESASSRVFGDYINPAEAVKFTYGNYGENNLPTHTVAEAKVTGLRIGIGSRIFEADSLEASLESYSDRRSAAQFRSLTATFTGLRLDDAAFTVSTRCDLFNQYDTKEKLCRAYRDDGQFRGAHQNHFFHPHPAATDELPESNGLIYGTIVNQVKWDKAPLADAVLVGNRLTVPGFGSLHFGEILIQEGFRRVSLVRFQLGSPDGGDGTAVDIGANGTGWPPELGGT